MLYTHVSLSIRFGLVKYFTTFIFIALVKHTCKFIYIFLYFVTFIVLLLLCLQWQQQTILATAATATKYNVLLRLDQKQMLTIILVACVKLLLVLL